MILDSFAKALGQLTDPRFLKVLLLGLGLTVGLLVGFYFGFTWLVTWLLPDTFTIPWIGEVTPGEAWVGWAAIPVILLLSVFLMVPVATAFIGIFLDEVADAVEAKHYPALPPARQVGILEGIWDAIKFLGVVIAVNLVALIPYLFLAPAAPAIFWVVNGILLGREYGQMVALRRNDTEGAAAFRRQNRPTLFLAGVLMAVPLTIPVVNLLVPILGAATFTHIYHRIASRRMASA